jgi:hypothetical protein
MSLFSVILVNAIIFSVISLLREDPLSPGMLDMFFRKYLRIIRLFVKLSLYTQNFTKLLTVQLK